MVGKRHQGGAGHLPHRQRERGETDRDRDRERMNDGERSTQVRGGESHVILWSFDTLTGPKRSGPVGGV